MNFLVTGANGQLGCELRALAPLYPQHRFTFATRAELDITDAVGVSRMVQQSRAQAIINCAAYTQVDRAEADAAQAEAINHFGAAHLAQAAKRADALLVHISTDYVFGGRGNTPFTEQDSPAPLGVYGHTKLAGELAVRASGCRHLILRTSWLYSSYGSNFVKTIRRLIAERQELKVVSDQVGSPTYAADLAAAILHILSQPPAAALRGTYHYSNEGVCSWYDFAVAIHRLSRASSPCRILPCRSREFPSNVQRPSFSVLDKAAIRRAFALPIPHWLSSLERCIHKLETDPKMTNDK